MHERIIRRSYDENGNIMEVALFGVFALIANITGPVNSIRSSREMLLTQYMSHIQHYRNIYPAMVVAFSTCSSSATLPITIESTKKRAGVPEYTVNLIAPPAATINMQACAAEMPIYAFFAA